MEEMFQDAYIGRIQVFRGRQGSLFKSQSEEESVRVLLKKTIESKPSAVSRHGLEWSIANVEDIDDTTISFRLGRNKIRTIGQKEATSGDFTDEKLLTSPHTLVILDWYLEVFLFIHNAELCPVESMPKHLANLLTKSTYAQEHSLTFVADAIEDPQDFIIWIKESYQVTKLQTTFTRPNLIDASEDFEKPLAKIADRMDTAPKGNKIILSNTRSGLDKDSTIAIVKGSSASINDVIVSAKSAPNEKPRSKKLKGNKAVTRVATSTLANKIDAAKRMRELYRKLKP